MGPPAGACIFTQNRCGLHSLVAPDPLKSYDAGRENSWTNPDR
jgi:hypothetical protein